jgi:hypothetical protein
MDGGDSALITIIITIIICTIISEKAAILTEVENQDLSTAPLGREGFREEEAAVLQEEAGEAIDEVLSVRIFSCLFCRNLGGRIWISQPKSATAHQTNHVPFLITGVATLSS